MSKVMPLPTSTTCGAPAARRVGRVVEPDQPRRVSPRPGRRRGCRRSRPSRSCLLVPDREVEAGVAWPASAACSASHCGVLTLEGTVRERRAPASRRRAIATAALERRAGASGVDQAGEHDPADRLRARGRSERQWKLEGAEHAAPRRTRAAPRRRRTARRREVATVSGPLVARASAAPARRRSAGRAVADPDEEHQPQVGVAERRGVEHDPLDDLAGLAGGRRGSSSANRSTPSSSRSSAAPGPSVRPPGLASTGTRHDVGADHGGRRDVADRDAAATLVAGRRRLGSRQRPYAGDAARPRAAPGAAGSDVGRCAASADDVLEASPRRRPPRR